MKGYRAVGLRIGQIDYANCFPVFSALRNRFDCSGYRFIRGTPAELNRMLQCGDIDLCPSSSIAYARSAQTYRLIPELSISSEGPVKSVILFSSIPLENLDGMPVGLTIESETSIALLTIILKKYYRFRNTYVRVAIDDSFDVGSSCPAVLIIGDTALRWSQCRDDLYQYDLGELWLSLTGLPFVFALWMIRDEVVVEMPEETARIRDQLLDAKQTAVATLEALASRCSEYAWFGQDAILDYWETISYDLTPRHIEGVKNFFRAASDVGILAREPALRFL